MNLIVYLSGGMKSGWQDFVIKEVSSAVTLINPTVHKFASSDEYTPWDLMGVDLSDIVFAYLEKTNPYPFGLAVELGYAKARGKRVILIDECPETTHYAMIRSCADMVYGDISVGVSILNRFALLKGEKGHGR